jgi:hypothetical protein
MLTTASAAGSWLDAPPAAWNKPGAPIPIAPPLQQSQIRCQNQERGPASPAESQLRAQGWRLESYWPATSKGNLTLVTALADYDGMCRPLEFNVFAFVSGTYAGTLSPVNMNSRTDGVLAFLPSGPNPTSGPAGSITATFERYLPTDPLCCPSIPSVTVKYGLANGVVAPLSIGAIPPHLPTTGGVPDYVVGIVVAAGILMVGLGLGLRHRSS